MKQPSPDVYQDNKRSRSAPLRAITHKQFIERQNITVLHFLNKLQNNIFYDATKCVSQSRWRNTLNRGGLVTYSSVYGMVIGFRNNFITTFQLNSNLIEVSNCRTCSTEG